MRAQGGDPDAPLPAAAEHCVVLALASGVLTRLDAYRMGLAAWRLGAGRARKEDEHPPRSTPPPPTTGPTPPG